MGFFFPPGVLTVPEHPSVVLPVAPPSFDRLVVLDSIILRRHFDKLQLDDDDWVKTLYLH